VRLETAPPSLDAAARERMQRVNEFLQQSAKERAAWEKADGRREARANVIFESVLDCALSLSPGRS
tara:strand:+ start:1944 stop:2141 length:198 start_codon:yes stop_codon:yes gene_type:complete